LTFSELEGNFSYLKQF